MEIAQAVPVSPCVMGSTGWPDGPEPLQTMMETS